MAAPLEKVKALLAALPKEDQAELRRYLGDILVSEDEAEQLHVAPGHVASLQARRGKQTITYTFRQERVRCGKEACWCSEGLGHGPYTYKYWRDPDAAGKLRKQYVGKPASARP